MKRRRGTTEEGGRGGRNNNSGRGRSQRSGGRGRGDHERNKSVHNNSNGRGRGHRGRHNTGRGRGAGRQQHNQVGRSSSGCHQDDNSYSTKVRNCALRRVPVVGKTVSTTSSESCSSLNGSTTIVTTLPWPDPTTHYIPIDQEETLLPVLVHWGASERGLMKDQPPFRLQKIQTALSNLRRKCKHDGNNNKSNIHDHQQKQQQQQKQVDIHIIISLIQSLSLRRHYLKLLNPTYSMSSLRLGNEDDIKAAATKFEHCVESYLRTHNVQYWTEQQQKSKTRRLGMLDPPSPDFMMKDGHSVELLLLASSSFGSNGTATDIDNDAATTTKSSSSKQHPLVINWIEAKMFYGASIIPNGSPNAVGCVIPKMEQYVSLYGTGAIVFMYGCGIQLAEQLLKVGVVALDARCLDLKSVEECQRKWCGDAWGNILF